MQGPYQKNRENATPGGTNHEGEAEGFVVLLGRSEYVIYVTVAVDEAFQTNDTEALNIVFDLIENQKIILGGSSGINIAGAIKLAKKIGPGKTIVTILCDHGRRYASKIFNKEFLKSKNLPIPKWLQYLT